MKSTQVLTALQDYLNDPEVIKSETVQALWSDYGEIARYFSPKHATAYIVKSITPPDQLTHHPRGWNTQKSHERKLVSYQVETAFYRHYAGLCDANCRVPTLFYSMSNQAKSTVHSKTDAVNSPTLLVMEDLDCSGYFVRRDNIAIANIGVAIRWLAYFHARFLNHSSAHLWPIGTYWHLDTRQDEFNVMPDSTLKLQASAIDKKLNSSKFKTLVHGDAKLANLCFSQDGLDVAAVDFQYVGCGVGVKDLAYLLGSCFDSEQLTNHSSELLNQYFLHFKNAVSHYQVDVDFDALEKEYRMLYPLAWADFYRFLIGWNPQSHKVNQYMQAQTKIALATL